MKWLLLLYACTLTLVSVPNAHALDDYVLLAPLPGLETTAELNEGEGGPVANYFSTIYQIGISLVLVFAVVMLIYGGIQYMTSDSIGGKSGGRETIGKAIIGIVLAVSSYALLFLIGGAGAVTVGFDKLSMMYGAPTSAEDTSSTDGESGSAEDSVEQAPQAEPGLTPSNAPQLSEPVATKTREHPDIEMQLLEATNATGSTSLIYQATWNDIPENAYLELELYQETNPGSNEFDQLIRTYEDLSDLGPDGRGSQETNQVDIDAGILANPTIARLKIYDSERNLHEEHLHGFGNVVVSNEVSEPTGQ